MKLDGIPISVSVIPVRNEGLFPNVDGAYRLRFDFENDGADHVLDCILDTPIPGGADSGEDLEAVTFEIGAGRLTIGCKSWQDADYGGQYLPNGLRLLLTPRTKSRTIFFGVSWMTCCGADDVQTWLAAAPDIA